MISEDFLFNIEDYDVLCPDIEMFDINIFEFGIGIYIKEWEFENF